MNSLQTPDKFKTLPEDPDAAKIFEYWFKTFESFYLRLQMLLITKRL